MPEHAHELTLLVDTGKTVADPDEDIRGWTVVDNTGEEIGSVDELLVDEQTERIHFLRVKHGGILGFGASTSFIPVEAVAGVRAGTVSIDRSREWVAGAPVYDPALIGQIDYYDRLYGYYGYAPFWVGGYIYPTLPVAGRGRRDSRS